MKGIVIGESLIRGPCEHTSRQICKNRDDANELGMGSYLYESPPAEEEPATKQVDANLERENVEAPTSWDDAGPSPSHYPFVWSRPVAPW